MFRTSYSDPLRGAERSSFAWTWRTACLGAGCGRTVDTVSGPTETAPKVVELQPGGRFVVELMPGQVAADVRAVAFRLAPALGAVALRVEPRGLRHVLVTLLSEDPLTGPVDRSLPVYTAYRPVMLGRDEQADRVEADLTGPAHFVVQGAQGSGKSTFIYGVLAQLAPASDVRVIGSDIHGLTLRPWATRPELAGWHALGTADPLAHVRMLERACKVMDDRIAGMPLGHDSLPIGPEAPLIVVVVEEVPGLMRVLGHANKDLEKRARGLIERLLAEGRKAGIRVVLVAQRADANILGGYARSQASHTVSFRVDSVQALQMLHSDADKGIAAEHSTATAGVALLSAPGVPLRRFRAPFLPYARYCDEVAHRVQEAA